MSNVGRNVLAKEGPASESVQDESMQAKERTSPEDRLS